MFNVDIPQFQ